jgi:hypothetical protein
MPRQHDNLTQQAVPMSAWVLTAVLAATLLIAMAVVGTGPVTPPSEAFQAFNAPRVETFRNADSDHYRIVMLGNSRLKYATWDEVQLEDLRAGETPLDVIRLVNDWATFADFEPFVPALLDSAPDLVIIQVEMMSQERSMAANVRFMRLYLKWLLFGGTGELWNPGSLDQADLQFGTPCEDIEPSAAAVAARLDRTGNWLTHDPHGPSSTAARQFVDELRRRGIAVAYLSIPRTSVMEDARPGATLTADALSAEERETIWRYPHSVGDEHFCDTIHLSESGRLMFSQWLTQRILDENQRQLPQDLMRNRPLTTMTELPAEDSSATASIEPQ